MRVKGVKALQTPSVYIIAVVAAFLLYYIDRHYGFNLIFAKTQEEFEGLKSGLPLSQLDQESTWHQLQLLALSILVLSLVLALKRVMDRRKKPSGLQS